MIGATGAAAGECRDCYRKVVTPPAYATVSEPVMVRAPQTYYRQVPPVYGTVAETVLVAPERTIAHRSPATYRRVAETVQVSPAGKVWQVRRDRHGREIGCWVKVPARFATQYRSVMVEPGSVRYETIPAQYATRQRTVLVRQRYVQRELAPAVYASRQRTVMVAPATASWQPIGHHRHRR
jgi:hypothetical protein